MDWKIPVCSNCYFRFKKQFLLRAYVGTIIAEDEEERVQDLRKMIDELRVRHLVHGLDPS